MHEVRFKELSRLGKKFLGVPASSAEVERMISIADMFFIVKDEKWEEFFFKFTFY